MNIKPSTKTIISAIYTIYTSHANLPQYNIWQTIYENQREIRGL